MITSVHVLEKVFPNFKFTQQYEVVSRKNKTKTTKNPTTKQKTLHFTSKQTNKNKNHCQKIPNQTDSDITPSCEYEHLKWQRSN